MVDTRMASATSRTVSNSCCLSLTVVIPCPAGNSSPTTIDNKPISLKRKCESIRRVGKNSAALWAKEPMRGEGAAPLRGTRLADQVLVPVDEWPAEQNECHRARREARTERNALLARAQLEPDQHDAHDRAVEEACEQTSDHFAPA